jgi:hypothetical protein
MEHTLHTFMGEDVAVEVKWEYEPEEKRTHDYPGRPEEYIINAVLVGGKDVQADCNDEYIETLLGRCRYEHNKICMEHYEQEQQER